MAPKETRAQKGSCAGSAAGLSAAQGATHHGDNLLLDEGRQGDQAEVEGEVELAGSARCGGRRREAYGGDEEAEGDGLLGARHGRGSRDSKPSARGRIGVWGKGATTVATAKRWAMIGVDVGGGGGELGGDTSDD